MTANYDNVAGAELAEWDARDESDEPSEQRHCKVEELYYESYNGEIVIRFEDRDTGRFFDLSIPVKADDNWNDFADSLPRWNNAD